MHQLIVEFFDGIDRQRIVFDNGGKNQEINTMVKTADTVNAKKVGIARLKAMFGLIPVLFIRLATMNCPQ